MHDDGQQSLPRISPFDRIKHTSDDGMDYRSARELMPLIEGFGQDIRYTTDRSRAAPRRELAHVLKVFLIDRAGFVREIYSSEFLYPRTVLNDIETLLLEERAR